MCGKNTLHSRSDPTGTPLGTEGGPNPASYSGLDPRRCHRVDRPVQANHPGPKPTIFRRRRRQAATCFGFGDTTDFGSVPPVRPTSAIDVRPDFLAGFRVASSRGIETTTYVLAGTVETAIVSHTRSLGRRRCPGDDRRQRIHTPGDAAGETPTAAMHGFQLWCEPSIVLKMTAPRPGYVNARDLPAVTDGRWDERARRVRPRVLGKARSRRTGSPPSRHTSNRVGAARLSARRFSACLKHAGSVRVRVRRGQAPFAMRRRSCRSRRTTPATRRLPRIYQPAGEFRSIIVFDRAMDVPRCRRAKRGSGSCCLLASRFEGTGSAGTGRS
jgi:hypothetical protein